MKTRALVLASFTILAICSVASAEQIPNPRYAHWARFNVETSNTSTGDMSMMGHKMDMDVVTTLKEKTPESITIQTQATMSMMGQKHPGRTTTQKIPASYDSEDTKNKVEKLPDETVEAMGKQIACKVYKLRVEDPEGTADIKVWVNDDIPGSVKFEFHVTTQQGEVTRSMTVQSVDIK